MNKITATEYFQDYSEKYEEYEECLEEIKEEDIQDVYPIHKNLNDAL